ncbi:uncharacterized protein TNCV_3739211 [Trichonephila clavipes]|nr:uncharacterized protein TNCV_3739211 [Trichonephila clavipes]
MGLPVMSRTAPNWLYLPTEIGITQRKRSKINVLNEHTVRNIAMTVGVGKSSSSRILKTFQRFGTSSLKRKGKSGKLLQEPKNYNKKLQNKANEDNHRSSKGFISLDVNTSIVRKSLWKLVLSNDENADFIILNNKLSTVKEIIEELSQLKYAYYNLPDDTDLKDALDVIIDLQAETQELERKGPSSEEMIVEPHSRAVALASTKRVSPSTNHIFTKRDELSQIGRIFDPLGLLGPVTSKAKLFMQQLWLLKLEWHEKLPVPVAAEWAAFVQSLPILEKLKIPRFVLSENLKSIILYGFSDASEKGFGAITYVSVI